MLTSFPGPTQPFIIFVALHYLKFHFQWFMVAQSTDMQIHTTHALQTHQCGGSLRLAAINITNNVLPHDKV